MIVKGVMKHQQIFHQRDGILFVINEISNIKRSIPEKQFNEIML